MMLSMWFFICCTTGLDVDELLQPLNPNQDPLANLQEARASFADAGAAFRALPAEELFRLGTAAREYQEERAMEINDAIEALLHAKEVVATSVEIRLQPCGVPNHLGHSRFSVRELMMLVDVYGSEDIQGKSLMDGVNDFGTVPEAPSLDEKDTIMEAVGQLLCPPELPDPWWWSRLGPERTSLRHVAFATDEDSDIWYLFLYAKLQPKEMMFLQMERRPFVLEAGEVAHDAAVHLHVDLLELSYLPLLVIDHKKASGSC